MLISTNYRAVKRQDVNQVLVYFDVFFFNTQMRMDYLVCSMGEFKRKEWLQESETTGMVI